MTFPSYKLKWLHTQRSCNGNHKHSMNYATSKQRNTDNNIPFIIKITP